MTNPRFITVIKAMADFATREWEYYGKCDPDGLYERGITEAIYLLSRMSGYTVTVATVRDGNNARVTWTVTAPGDAERFEEVIARFEAVDSGDGLRDGDWIGRLGLPIPMATFAYR